MCQILRKRNTFVLSQDLGVTTVGQDVPDAGCLVWDSLLQPHVLFCPDLVILCFIKVVKGYGHRKVCSIILKQDYFIIIFE